MHVAQSWAAWWGNLAYSHWYSKITFIKMQEICCEMNGQKSRLWRALFASLRLAPRLTFIRLDVGAYCLAWILPQHTSSQELNVSAPNKITRPLTQFISTFRSLVIVVVVISFEAFIRKKKKQLNEGQEALATFSFRCSLWAVSLSFYESCTSLMTAKADGRIGTGLLFFHTTQKDHANSGRPCHCAFAATTSVGVYWSKYVSELKINCLKILKSEHLHALRSAVSLYIA